ncbi:MAG: hypothetical protein HYY13_08530, partial [Nitrospirae bacterium]|nr:hypothetical protein [Nitrospirota bacterium]
IPALPGHSSLPVRHVVPIFITNDQIRLYFTTTTTALSADPATRSGCTTATAMSNY